MKGLESSTTAMTMREKKEPTRHPKGPFKNRFIRGWPTQLYKNLPCSLTTRCGTRNTPPQVRARHHKARASGTIHTTRQNWK
ncbi:hypothetical protein GmHk_01G000012 [Glycine max]|nr:hypothetical protein GmHk_01G000012 [Glycine max]